MGVTECVLERTYPEKYPKSESAKPKSSFSSAKPLEILALPETSNS